jgi:hypothetical protein
MAQKGCFLNDDDHYDLLLLLYIRTLVTQGKTDARTPTLHCLKRHLRNGTGEAGAAVQSMYRLTLAQISANMPQQISH